MRVSKVSSLPSHWIDLFRIEAALPGGEFAAQKRFSFDRGLAALPHRGRNTFLKPYELYTARILKHPREPDFLSDRACGRISSSFLFSQSFPSYFFKTPLFSYIHTFSITSTLNAYLVLKMLIFIRGLDCRSFPLEVETSTTVDELKTLICKMLKQEGHECTYQLIFAGIVLGHCGNVTLGEHGISKVIRDTILYHHYY